VDSLILAAAFGYLLGSFPTAFLVVRWKSKIDIRAAGTGNVGTLNSFVVTRSKAIAVTVLCVDLLKGALAVVLAREFVGESFPLAGASGVCAVLGHNFPVWLGFRGGRGLATAAGVMIVLSWVFLALWLVLWLGAYFLLREINPASALTSVIVLGSIFLAPLAQYQSVLPAGATVESFRAFGSLLILIILIKHVQPLKEYVAALRNKKEKA
jgi:acyl phosphate:glycerol-3-phosphate acyltransferase